MEGSKANWSKQSNAQSRKKQKKAEKSRKKQKNLNFKNTFLNKKQQCKVF
jgi:hypothetical protein